MHDDTRPLARGDAFVLPGVQPIAFGVVEVARPEHGVALVRMQNGFTGWATVGLIERGRELVQQYAVDGCA